MELIWQTNGFQEYHPDLYGKMVTFDRHFSCYCNLELEGLALRQEPSLSSYDPICSFTLASHDILKKFSSFHTWVFFIPF